MNEDLIIDFASGDNLFFDGVQYYRAERCSSDL